MATKKEQEEDDNGAAKAPTQVRVKQTRMLKLSGADAIQIPDTSTVPNQVYLKKDFEKIKNALAEEGISLEITEEF